jgi:hypothetical protein
MIIHIRRRRQRTESIIPAGIIQVRIPALPMQEEEQS